jgi:hypothetical protein
LPVAGDIHRIEMGRKQDPLPDLSGWSEPGEQVGPVREDRLKFNVQPRLGPQRSEKLRHASFTGERMTPAGMPDHAGQRTSSRASAVRVIWGVVSAAGQPGSVAWASQIGWPPANRRGVPMPFAAHRLIMPEMKTMKNKPHERTASE